MPVYGIILEKYMKNENDIYYNKDKFDSDKINLCFITGHSGSGKSTMGREMSNNNNIEHYDLDDVITNWLFSDKNLKEYGNLIYSFFKGPGKRFRYTSYNRWIEDKYWDNKDEYVDGYEISLVTKFIKYAINYAKSHNNKKFVIEGIWLFYFIKPEIIKDYAVYIKGTSMIISKIRASKRNSNDAENNIERIKAFSKTMSENWKIYFINEKKINHYRDYFSKLIGGTNNNE